MSHNSCDRDVILCLVFQEEEVPFPQDPPGCDQEKDIDWGRCGLDSSLQTSALRYWGHWDSPRGALGQPSGDTGTALGDTGTWRAGAVPHQSHRMCGSCLKKINLNPVLRVYRKFLRQKLRSARSCCFLCDIVSFYKFRAWGLWHHRPKEGVNDFFSLLGNLSYLLSQFSSL